MGWQNFVAAIIQAGNTTIINSQGSFTYNGTPALNNLVVSTTPATGTDPYGNAFLAGETVYRNTAGGWVAANLNPSIGGTIAGALTLYTAASEAGPWIIQGNFNGDSTGSVWLQSSDGSQLTLANNGIANLIAFSGLTSAQLNILDGTAGITLQTNVNGFPYVIPSDGLTYGFGHMIRRNTGSILINSTTPITLYTFSGVTQVGYYQFRSVIHFSSSAGTAQPMFCRLAGNCVMDEVSVHTNVYTDAANAPNQPGVITAQNADTSFCPNLGASTNYWWRHEGYFHVSGVGGLTFTARQGTSAASETFSVLPGSWAELKPTL